MTARQFVWTILAIEVGFALADMADRHRTRHTRYAGEHLHRETALFLTGIAVVFALIQYGALALAPPMDAISNAVRARLAPLATTAVVPPRWAVIVLSGLLFYVAGLWDYLFHRFLSHSRWLWFTHENHHLPNQVFVAMPGLFSRPFAIVSVIPVVAATSATAYLLAIALGFRLWDWSFFEVPLLLSAAVLTASHSSFLNRIWGMHHVMKRLALTTPQEHILHHAVDLRGNYGNFTTLWDRAFGTYLDPLRPEHRGHACGLPYDQDFVGTLTWGLVKLSPAWRRRLQISRYCNLDEPNP